MQTGMCYLDNVIQFTRLLLHLGCKEQSCWYHRLQKKNKKQNFWFKVIKLTIKAKKLG